MAACFRKCIGGQICNLVIERIIIANNDNSEFALDKIDAWKTNWIPSGMMRFQVRQYIVSPLDAISQRFTQEYPGNLRVLKNISTRPRDPT